MECEHCKILVKTKYSLKSHLVNNKACLKLRGLTLDTQFICKGCNAIFMNNTNLCVHTDSCRKYIVVHLQEEHKRELGQLSKGHLGEIEKLEKEHKREMERVSKGHLDEIERLKKEQEKMSQSQSYTDEMLEMFFKKSETHQRYNELLID